MNARLNHFENDADIYPKMIKTDHQFGPRPYIMTFVHKNIFKYTIFHHFLIISSKKPLSYK